MRTAKQRQLLVSHFLDLKETYMVEGKTAFNKKFNSINGLGRSTKVLLLSLQLGSNCNYYTKDLAAHNPIPDVDGLPGWAGNVTVALMLASFVEETTYHTFCMVPGSQWFNSSIAAPAAAVSAYACAGVDSLFPTLSWYTKEWKCMAETIICTD